ncbi:MAG: hypothetical protein IJY41_01640 [Clostridia bacterium]|nr:hypothetical protein [Clostridia bacterium]
MKVTFFDVEYANTRSKSICQIGILSRALTTGENEARLCIYVNPEDTFDENCIRVHGITNDMVKDAPTLDKVWTEIEKYFRDSVVIGHNVAAADLDALYRGLVRYNITPPEIYYVCTYRLSREKIPSFLVEDYSLPTLCNFFNIDIPKSHSPLYDACSASDLLDKLSAYAPFDIEKEIKLFSPKGESANIDLMSDKALKEAIHGLYGMLRGFELDGKVSKKEIEYIIKWRDSFAPYKDSEDIGKIINVIDEIAQNGSIGIGEIGALSSTVKQQLDIVNTSAVTLSTQILNGIIRGIITDDEITVDECKRLRTWLYSNSYLAGHHPFDKIIAIIETALWDGKLSLEEARVVRAEINQLLPTLPKEKISLAGKRICLSGSFAYGKKSAVMQYITDRGGTVQRGVTKSTDMLIVGKGKGATTSNVKKAMEYNSFGGSIEISNEAEVLEYERTFSDLLFDYIDESGLSDAQVYKKAGLPRQMMSKIKCLPDYKPSKSSICAFIIALKLDINKANTLLASAGYILSPSIDFDRIILKSIKRKNYDIDSINEALYTQGLSCLGTK